MHLPQTAVVVAAYNQNDWLELVLSALAAQSDPDFEDIVADDGSKPRAAERATELARRHGLELTTVEQEDAGFRKARIQNLAVASTNAELLVFLDADCVPFRSLVGVYRRAAVAGEFLVGAVSYLDQETTERMTPELVRAGEHEVRLGRREGLRVRSVHLKNLWHAGGKRTRPRLKGGNFCVARDLFEHVDGFDEVYCGYGKEDSDLRNRMRNSGARGISLWHRARASHLYWGRPFGRGREDPPEELYEEGLRRIRARRGLSAHLAPKPE